MLFLNQEINPTTTSNPESKSQPIIKEHEHQTYKKKKKKHEHHQIKEHEQKQTQENEDWHKPEKNIEIKTQAREVNLEKIKNPMYRNHNPNLQKIK